MTRVIVKSDLHKLCGHTMKPLAWSVWLLIDPKWISMEQHGGCCLYVIQRTVDVWGHTYKSGRFSMGYGLQLFAIPIIGVLPLVPLGRLWGGSGGGGGDNIIGSYKGQRLTPVIYRVDWLGHRQHVPYPNWNRSPIILWLISPFKLWKTGARSRIRRWRLLFSIVNNGWPAGLRWPFNGAETGPSSSPLICHQPRVVIVNSKPVERLCGRNPFDESNVYTNAHWTRSFLVSSDK